MSSSWCMLCILSQTINHGEVQLFIQCFDYTLAVFIRYKDRQSVVKMLYQKLNFSLVTKYSWDIRHSLLCCDLASGNEFWLLEAELDRALCFVHPNAQSGFELPQCHWKRVLCFLQIHFVNDLQQLNPKCKKAPKTATPQLEGHPY